MAWFKNPICKSGALISWLSFAILWLPASALAQLYLYGIDLKKNTFIRVNISTTQVEDLGDPYPNLNYESMAFDPATSLVFFTVDKDPALSNSASLRTATKNNLNSADPVTVSLVAGLPSSDIESLSVNPLTGELFGVDNGEKKLVKINKSTGAVTDVSASSESNLSGVEGLAFTITVPPELYAVARLDGHNRLVKVDIVSGTATRVDPTNTIGFDGKIKALAFGPGPDIFTPGTLYGFHDDTHEFITINRTTGIGASFSVIDITSSRKIEGLTFLKPDKLIPVELSQFAARAESQKVILNWVTQSETENLGFHVYRSLSRDGEYVKINNRIIPGQGSSARAHSYRYEDTGVEEGKTYYYKIADLDFNGVLSFHGPVEVTLASIPDAFFLAQSYPNPLNIQQANARTLIRYKLSGPGAVKLAIYNILGQTIKILVNENQEAGSYSVSWNGKNQFGQKVLSGIYLYHLQANGFSNTRKLIVVR